MSDDKANVNKDIINEVFKMAKITPPKDITDEALMDAVFKLRTIVEPSQNISGQEAAYAPPSSNNILVIDDIGVVTYQLKILFKNLGYNVEVARDIFSGLNAFVKTTYAFVIMDLFVSTEQEGYTLLNETKKIITKNNLDTKIVVITASNKAENKVKCLNGGADVFLKKDAGWQDKLIEVIETMHEGA